MQSIIKVTKLILNITLRLQLNIGQCYAQINTHQNVAIQSWYQVVIPSTFKKYILNDIMEGQSMMHIYIL